ncbi:MAG: hypothetical protein P8130_06275 [Deltaproteobacteria bacterium]
MRLVTIIGLVLSFLVLGKGALQSWQAIEIPKMRGVLQKKRVAATPERQNFEVNPKVPVLMPDLNTGYLFNAQRNFTEHEAVEEDLGEDVAIQSSQVNMESLVYSGSIILGHLRKGMVSFSLKEEGPPPVSRRRGRPMAPRQISKAAMQTAMVDEGDDFYGFKVDSVQSDRIIFSKNGTTIEKMLYDPNKERTVAAASPNRPGGRGKPSGLGSTNGRAGAVPPPRQTGQERHRPELTQPTMHPVTGASSAAANPANQNSRNGNIIRRPRLIQRRRLPVQTR